MSFLSFFGTVTAGIWPTVLKWTAIGGAMVALCAGTFIWGEHLGSSSQLAKQMAADVKVQERTIIQEKIQTVVDTTAVDNLQKKVDALTATNTSLQAQIAGAQQVTKIEQTPTGPVCELGTDWIKIYNESLQ